MGTASPGQDDQEPPTVLTLREAAQLYAVAVHTLSRHVRCGQLAGFKSRGLTGQEWRVTSQAMDEAGYRRRRASAGVAVEDSAATSDDAARELARLRRQLAVARRATVGERRRADDLDRRLGHALLECGRLRAALAAARGDEPASEPELDRSTARWLISAITDGSAGQAAARTSGQTSPAPTAHSLLDPPHSA